MLLLRFVGEVSRGNVGTSGTMASSPGRGRRPEGVLPLA